MLKPAAMKNWVIKTLATGFGLGWAPVAPGTFGTLGAIPLYILLSQFSPLAYMAATLALIILAVFVAELAESLFQSYDSKHVVIDEVVGFLVAMVWVPVNLKNLAVGFLLFRLFDALKPWPISVLDRRIKGGIGVVIDDVAAGLITSVLMQFFIGEFQL